MRIRAATMLLVLTLVLSPLFAYGATAAGASCVRAGAGGEWANFGRDLANTRTQQAPGEVGAPAAPLLSKRWAFSSVGAGGTGTFQSTAAVAGGCVYAGTSTGWVFGVSANTGELVWKRYLGPPAASLGGLFGLAVAGGDVVGIMSGPNGPYAFSLDGLTGREVWRSAVIDSFPGDYSNASAVVFRGLLFVGYSSPEGEQDSRGGFALVDTATGKVLKRTYVVPDSYFRKGYGGAGIWATPAIDASTGYAYVGVGNPYTTNKEYRYTNAIVKIDLDRSRSTFGTIVDGMKGNVDQYYPEATALADTPVCEQAPLPADLDRPWCGQLDVDFGSAPNLYRNSAGEVLVAEQQKSGVMHVAYADTMEEAWSAVVGLPCQACNAEAHAYDGKRIYVVGTPGGYLWALDPDTGHYDWVAPVVDGIHYQAITVAAGVVYTADTKGNLDLFDAATGAPLGQRPMSLDTGSDACVALSGGVTVAEGSIFATCDEGAQGGGWIIAYD